MKVITFDNLPHQGQVRRNVEQEQLDRFYEDYSSRGEDCPLSSEYFLISPLLPLHTLTS